MIAVAQIPVRSRRSVKRLDLEQLDSLLTFIDENIRADISVARLSSELGMSVSHFSHRFKATVGVPPLVFIARRKMLVAARLLTHTDVPLEEIVERIGFSNLGHFRKRFRTYLGCNPSELRMPIPDVIELPI